MAAKCWRGEEKKAGIVSPFLMNKQLNTPSDLFLTKGPEIERVKRLGQRIQTPFFNLVYFEGGQPRTKAGIIVGRRLGKAVLRNRAKRIFRELVRTTQKGIHDRTRISHISQKSSPATEPSLHFEHLADHPFPSWTPRFKTSLMMHRLFLSLIRVYQGWISPFLGPHCRFDPSCSRYAYEAIEQYGVFRGVTLLGIRLLKCHPFHPGGS